MQKAIKKVQGMSNSELVTVWNSLTNYDPSENYAEGVTMDDWCQLIYSEMDKRGIPHF